MDISADKQGRQKFSFKATIRTKTAILTGFFGLVAALFYCLSPDWCFTLAVSFTVVFYQLVVRLIIYYSVRAVLKREKFYYENRYFKEKRWEPKLYKLMGVRGLKNKFPPFFPQKLTLDKLDRLIRETCLMEIAHAVVIPLGYIPFVFAMIAGEWAFSIPLLVVALSGGLIDFYALAAQRYNRPRLIRLTTRNFYRQ